MTGKHHTYLLLVLLALANGLCYGQKAIVALSADKKEAGVDEQLTFRVSTNIEGSINIDFPVDFEIDNGIMHFMESKMDPSGKVKTYYIIQQSGSFRKTGTYSFTATVTRKNITYKSNKFSITIDESSSNKITIHSEDPVFGYIEANKTTVYEGEPVLLNAKVISKYSIIKVEGYLPYKADKNAEEHSFNTYREYIEESKLNGKKVQTFEYGKQLVFPVSTGKCRLKPFEMALRCHSNIFDRTFRFKSSGLVVNVKPLPKGAPSNFIGGVGEFDLKHELSSTKGLKVGDVVTLQLTISGTGNLHNIQDPKLNLPSGCKLYGDPERDESIQFTESGATGNIVFAYHIQITEEGEFKFEAPSISYFDPEKEKYINIQSTPFNFSIGSKVKSVAVTSANGPQASTSPEMNPLKQSTKEKSSESPMLTTVLGVAIPGATVALFFLFLFVRRKQKQRDHEMAVEAEKLEVVHPQLAISKEQSNFWSEIVAHRQDANMVAITLPKAIIQVLEERFSLAAETREKVLQVCAERDKELEKELRDIIATCDHFRYGFGVKELPTETLLERVSELLKLKL